MSKLIGTGGLLVTAGIAEQDIRRLLCAAAFEELSDRCQIARAAALKMSTAIILHGIKVIFLAHTPQGVNSKASYNDFSFQDHSHDPYCNFRMGSARKGKLE